MGVSETGLGLAVMNRMRKAAGFNILLARDGQVTIRSGSGFPDYMLG